MIRLHSLRSLLVVVVSLLVAPACTRKTEGGLLLVVTVEAGVRADCLVVDATNNGARVSRSVVARDPKKTAYYVGISRGDFPASLTWQASTFQGRCADDTSWKLTSRSEEKTQAFPASGVDQFELLVSQPDAALDADRDTFVDEQKGGTDCNDADAQVNPGAAQVCGSTVDTNCNGKLYCADPTCASDPACAVQANGLAFETMLPTLPAGDCSLEVVVQSTANGRPSAVGADTSVTLSPTGVPAGDLLLFSDTACATPLGAAGLTLRFGSSRTSFSFRARTAGSLSLSASAMDLGTATLTTEITNRPVDRLEVTPASLSVRAGACSAAFQVTALDAQRQPTNSTSGLPLAISFLPAGTTSVTTFTDSACNIQGTPSIGSGTSSTTFYVRATTATGATPLTVQVATPTVNNGLPASADLVVTPGDPDRMAFTSPTTGVANTTCGVMPLELQLLDVNGNVAPAPAAGVSVNLTYVAPPTTGTLDLFSGPGCNGASVTSVTIAGGSSSAFLSVRANGAGLYTVTATSSLPMPSATTQVSVATMNPTALVFPSPTTVIQAGAGVCSPAVRVQTRESNSLAAAVSPVPADVQLTISPSPAGAVSLFSDSTCATALGNPATVTMRGGTSEQLFYFRSSRAQALTLSVSAAGSGLSTTTPEQSARVVPGPTTKLVFSPLTLAAVAGACSSQVTVSSSDAFDNFTSSTATVTLAASPTLTVPTGVAFSSLADCSTTGTTAQLVDGGAVFHAVAQRAQLYSLSGTSGTATSQAPVVFSVDAGSPSVFAVVTQPMGTLAAGSCSTVTIERRDAFGNPSPGGVEPVTITPDSLTVLTVHPDLATCMGNMTGAPVTFAAGQTRATFAVRGRLVGTSALTVSSTLGAATIVTSSVAVTASATTRLRFSTAPPGSSTVGVCSTAVVERLDVEGNPTGLPNVFNATVTASGAGASGLLLSVGTTCGTTATTSVSLAFGSSATARFSYDPRTLGAITFDVTSSGITSASASTTVGGGGVARVRFVTPPTTGNYDTCQDFTLEALDVGNNQVTTPTVVNLSANALGTFWPSSGCSNTPNAVATIPASGTVTVSFLPLALGSVTLTAAASSGTPGTAPLTISAGVERQLTRAPAFMANTTAGTCTVFTVTRVDSGMNAAGGGPRTVTVTLSGAASVAPFEAQLFAGMGCASGGVSLTRDVTILSAASTVQFSVLVRKAGALNLALTSAGAPSVTLPADTATTVVAGPLAALRFAASPPGPLVTNVCSPMVTVSADDGFGNAVALGNQALAMTGATFSSLPDCTDTITGLAAGVATSADFYFKNTTAGMQQLSVGMTPTVVSQTWNIVAPTPTTLRWKPTAMPPTTLARFTCSSAIRVQAVDGTGALGPTTSPRVLGFTSAPLGLRFFSDSACTTPLPGTFGLLAGASETADFFLAGVVPNSHLLTATDTTATGALASTTAEPVDITGAGTPALTVTEASTDLHYKGCIDVTIRRGVGAVDVLFGTTSVNLSMSGTGTSGATLHASSDCSGAGASTLSVSIPPGMAVAHAYLRGRSAEPTDATLGSSGTTLASLTVSADDGAALFASGVSGSINVHPLVRRGSCSMAANQASVSCTIAPPLPLAMRNRSLFTVQALAVGSPDGSTGVSCSLTGTTSIDCVRAGTDTASDIRWQVVSMATGLDVTHFAGSFAMAENNPTPRTIDVSSAGLGSTSEAFLLFGLSTGRTNFDASSQATARLTSTSSVSVRLPSAVSTWPNPVANYSLQVVKLAGVTTTRGETSSSSGQTSFTASVSAPAVSTDQALLFSTRINLSSGGACASRLRGVVTNNTTLTFTRGDGSCGGTPFEGVSWERLSFARSTASVTGLGYTISNNTDVSAGQDIAVGAAPLDRVWSFLSSQGPGGQSGGETDQTLPGFSTARLDYVKPGANTQLVLTRGGAAGSTSSRFQAYVVTFVP